MDANNKQQDSTCFIAMLPDHHAGLTILTYMRVEQ
jgi:hypothetical protein